MCPHMGQVILPACCLQIENEYGFCGSSKTYLRHLAATARQHLGNETILYTTDPPAIAPKGSIYGEEVYTCGCMPCCAITAV
jgi:beta-galactosidase